LTICRQRKKKDPQSKNFKKQKQGGQDDFSEKMSRSGKIGCGDWEGERGGICAKRRKGQEAIGGLTPANAQGGWCEKRRSRHNVVTRGTGEGEGIRPLLKPKNNLRGREKRIIKDRKSNS